MANINTAYSVTEVNRYIKKILSNDFILSNILVKGEISNFKNHSSGHLYFSLKDENAVIKCVMFRMEASQVKFKLEDGMKVIISGYVSAYERDGQYQLYCDSIVLDGVGDLYVAYEKLKEKLEKEGLFDETRKKKLPLLPESVAVITSKTGAVLRDIVNVSLRRYPNAHIKLLPASVQGEDAYKEIVRAIELVNEKKLADVIIVGRGGGSIEDLWNFNREEVAYAIYKSEIPVVSAVGHQTDFTIADFVADLRAPTPSAAAELVFPDITELNYKINTYKKNLKTLLLAALNLRKKQLSSLENSYIMKRPLEIVNKRSCELDNYQKELVKLTNDMVKAKKKDFGEIVCKLDVLSPLKTLTRGYSIVRSEDKLIVNADDVKVGDKVNVKLKNGEFDAIRV